MDDARRFLRYVMPGIVYGVETIFLLWITCPTWTQRVITNNLEKDNLGVILGSVLVFGGLGYIFSTIHHARETGDEEDRIFDHKSIAMKIEPGWKGTWEEAMAFSYAHWYTQMNLGNIHDDANKKVHSLGDQAHGLGTANIASFASYLTTLVICSTELFSEPEPGFRFFLMVVLWFWVTYLFDRGYQRVGKIAHETYEMILMDALSRKTEKPPCIAAAELISKQ